MQIGKSFLQGTGGGGHGVWGVPPPGGNWAEGLLDKGVWGRLIIICSEERIAHNFAVVSWPGLCPRAIPGMMIDPQVLWFIRKVQYLGWPEILAWIRVAAETIGMMDCSHSIGLNDWVGPEFRFYVVYCDKITIRWALNSRSDIEAWECITGDRWPLPVLDS